MSRSDGWREPPGVSIASGTEGGERDGRWLHKEQQKGGKPRETLTIRSLPEVSPHGPVYRIPRRKSRDAARPSRRARSEAARSGSVRAPPHPRAHPAENGEARAHRQAL